MNPTDEQAAAADAFHAGHHLALQAGAGTGKTTTLALLARGTTRRGRYLAYNRAIAQDAAARFPDTVQCKTAHALAYAAVGHRYTRRLNAPRRPPGRPGRPSASPSRSASANATSHTRPSPTPRCAPWPASATPPTAPSPATTSPACAAWKTRTCTPNSPPTSCRSPARPGPTCSTPMTGLVRFDHDHYLKIWALTQPKIDADFLLLDEAQDTNPVVEQVFLAQRGHAQLVMVGDSAQAIYGWRGARDVMTGFDGTQLALSPSFRFGPHLAQEANRWLALADAPIRLTGTDTIPTELGHLARPDAVLCRTNVGAMAEVMSLLAAGHRVALAGGGEQPARSGPGRPRPQGGPPHLPPRTGAVRLLGRTAGLRRPRPRRTRPAAAASTSSTPTAPTPSSTAVDHLTTRAARRGHRLHRPQGQRPRMAQRQDRRRLPPAQGHRPARRQRPPHPGTGQRQPKPASPTSPSPAPATASTSAASPGSTSTPAETRRHAESSSATRGGWAAAVTASRKRARDVPAPLSRPRRRGRAAHGLADAHGVGRGRWR